MKLGFSGIPTSDVEITHGDQTVKVTLKALPFGYGDVLEVCYPKPVKFVNSKPVPDPAAEAVWASRGLYLRLARAAVGLFETQAPPPDAKREVWDAYAIAIGKELEDANFLDQDVYTLMSALHELNRGSGAVPGKT